MIRKVGGLLVALAAVAVGWKVLSTDSHELDPERIVVRSEGFERGSMRWAFDADDSQGRPLEAVFYTLQCTPDASQNAVDVVVRLYETPADGRRKLRRTGERGSSTPEFELTCTYPEGEDAAPGVSYRISFGGRNLGTWRMNAEDALAATLAE